MKNSLSELMQCLPVSKRSNFWSLSRQNTSLVTALHKGGRTQNMPNISDSDQDETGFFWHSIFVLCLGVILLNRKKKQLDKRENYSGFLTRLVLTGNKMEGLPQDS